jgi:hypothetical protein
MQIGLYADNTLALPVVPLCEYLNALCKTIRFSAGVSSFRLRATMISAETTTELLSHELLTETDTLDLAVLATNVPYDNNYFYESHDHRHILSFAGWNALTDLPLTNGLVYLLAGIIADDMDIGVTHNETTGCVNDFMWDKGIVDTGMRAAFICKHCLSTVSSEPSVGDILVDVSDMLDAVSRASRAHLDILATDLPKTATTLEQAFDVFLCHNSGDKPAVRKVNLEMGRAGIRTWLDEEQLEPGLPWQVELERQIRNIKRAAVFVGESGVGPWQSIETRAFLDEFATRGCPVIPVLLPGAPAAPELPIFLRQLTWVDMRSDQDRSLDRLIGAVKGRS